MAVDPNKDLVDAYSDKYCSPVFVYSSCSLSMIMRSWKIYVYPGLLVRYILEKP